MKVRRSSWHYRLWRVGRLTFREPKSLCPYFWAIFFRVAFILAVVIGIPLVSYDVIKATGIITFFEIVGMIVGSLIGTIGLMIVIDHIQTRLRTSRDRRFERELYGLRSEPNIVIEFIKAKKARLCPLIEVVDDPK